MNRAAHRLIKRSVEAFNCEYRLRETYYYCSTTNFIDMLHNLSVQWFWKTYIDTYLVCSYSI